VRQQLSNIAAVRLTLAESKHKLHFSLVCREGDVKYTVRPRHDNGNGAFSIAASEAREALEAAKGLVERGVRDVEILSENGVPYDLTELEREAEEHERAALSGEPEA
jgi:hypothetical protein